MKELFKEIKEFQETYFPQSNALSKAKHLQKEVEELLFDLETLNRDESTRMEYADCFLLLVGSLQAYGMTYEDLMDIVKKKLEINRNRKWGKPDENGVVLHIKD